MLALIPSLGYILDVRLAGQCCKNCLLGLDVE